MELFNECHHYISSGMGGLSINLFHLPHPGRVTDQGAKLLRMFRVIKEELYAKTKRDLERQRGA